MAERVAIIGAGVIGLSWAELFARAGWEVAVFDVAAGAVPEGAGYLVADSVEAAVAGAAFVQENGPERLEIKRELLGRIAAAAGEDTVIASSTSTLLPSLLAEGNARAAQIIVGHPYNPPAIMPLVEVVPGPDTRPDIVTRATEVYRALGKHPVALKREIPGFVGNRVQKAVLDEAMWLVQQGVVDPADFDAIFRDSLGLRWASIGVFEASHLGGGPGGIRHLLEHVGVALDAFTLEKPSRDPAAAAALIDAVEHSYGGADSYGARAARRDRITRAVAQTVAREHETSVLYALTPLTGGVHRIDPDTGAVAQLVSGLTEVPDGIVIDPIGEQAVFTLMGAPDRMPAPGEEPPFTQRNGSVQAVPLTGGDPSELVACGTFTTGKQLARDAQSGRLYWADREGRAVYRSEADGTSVTALVVRDGRGPDAVDEECVGVAVDPVGGYLYWTQKGAPDAGRGRIFRAGLELPEGEDAAHRSDIEVLWHGLPEPIDLELDTAAGMIYWTDRGAEPDGNTLNRAPIPAAGVPGEVPAILARGFREAIGLALDHARGIAYVADLGGDIRAIELRTGAERIVATFHGGVTGLALAQA
ncbi:hypothetical protein GCM10027064_17090 [Microbacterium petrolearium]